MKRLILASVTLIVASLTMVASAWAETTKICVPEKPSKPVLSASAKNECPTKSTTKYKTVELPGTVELGALDKILPHVTFVESGVDGKPTIQFSGVNVQVVNGEGKTATTNGEGNLVIGYDENSGMFRGNLGNPKPGVQSGSHNLVLGEEQEFTSYGGVVGGFTDSVTAPFASVISGDENVASGTESVISGGAINHAAGGTASISGGVSNVAGEFAWVGGGSEDNAAARLSSIFGGNELTTKNEFEAIP